LRLSHIVLLMLISSYFCSSACGLPTENYKAMRKDLDASSYASVTAKSSPRELQGKVVELRGTVSGLASGSDTTRIILRSESEHYVLLCDTTMALPSSRAEIAALVRIGEGSVFSLTDLRLVAWCHSAELRALEQAAEIKVQSQVQVVKKVEPARNARVNQLTSRGGYDHSHIVEAYRKAIASFNPRLSSPEVERITNTILQFSAQYDVDPRLIVALVLAESNFRPDATSPKGAMGLGQLMPGTARGLGVRNAYDPEENLAASIRLIRGHLDKQSSGASYGELTWADLELALASYNAGPGAVRRHGGVPPYRETQNYIRKVVEYYRQLCGIN
jgi:hypothetical protein